MFLDIGGYELKAIVINQKKNEVIASATQPNTGIRSGYVLNGEMFKNALQIIVKKCEKQIKGNISNAIIIIGGKLAYYKIMNTTISSIKQVIDCKTIKFVEDKIKAEAYKNQEFLIQNVYIEYKIDNFTIENPIGLYGDTLQSSYFVVLSKINQLGSVISIVESLNINIIDIYPSILCTGNQCSSEDERILGNIVFDIGCHKIDWVYYFKNKPIDAGYIDIGSEDITYDIAKSFKLNLSEAEKLKHNHLSALLEAENFCNWASFVKNGNIEYILESEITRKTLPLIDTLSSSIKNITNKFNKRYSSVTVCGNGGKLKRLIDVLQNVTNFKNIKIYQESTNSALFGAAEQYNKTNDKDNLTFFEKCARFFEKYI